MSVMKTPSLPATGGCQCGALRFRVDKAPLITAVCHCRDCQRMTAAPYSTTAMIPTDGFTITAGDPTRGGLGTGERKHFHCPKCMALVFTRVAPREDMFVNVRATLFDDPSWFSPFVETFTNAQFPWATTGAPHSFPEFPEIPEFMTLVAAYAAATAPDATKET